MIWLLLLSTPPEEAAALVQQGIELRRSHQDGEALKAFQSAQVLDPSPRTLSQIGLAEQALGLWVDAERDLFAALAAVDPWIDQHRDALAGALDAIRAHLAWLEVTADVEGAELFIDGARIGALPQPALRLPSGEVRVVVKRPDYVTFEKLVRLAPRANGRERVVLAKIGAQSVAANVALEPDPRRLAGWLTLGAGGLLLAGGITSHLLRESAAGTWNDDAVCLLGSRTRGESCPDTRSEIRTTEILAITSYAAAGVALAIGGVLLGLADPPVTCAPAALGVGCAGRF